MELSFEEMSQFLLGEGRVLALALPQPGPTFRRHLVRVTMAMINERLPGRTSLAIAMAELGQIVPAEGQT
jgi:hypothetical protein